MRRWPACWPTTMRNPIEVASDRTRRTDSMLVSHDKRWWWYVVGLDMALFITTLVLWWALPDLARHSWLAVVAAIFVGIELGRTAILSARRAQAYRSGWLAGRQQMVMAMVEAQRRGITPVEWLTAEAERDWAVLGLDPDDVNAAIAEAIRRNEGE